MTDLVVVSYRGPVVFDRDARGRICAPAPPGGLVAGLLALPWGESDGVWVCAALSDEDRVVAAEGRQEVAVGEVRVPLRMVDLPPQAQEQLSALAANPVLWLLQHELWDLASHPTFGPTEHAAFGGYAAVNATFADAVVRELDAHGPDVVVMTHDYHLYLVASHVRAHRPEVFLHHFVHIPWPPPEMWSELPVSLGHMLLRGLLANDVVAFHTEVFVRNFIETCRRVLSLPVDVDRGLVYVDGRVVAVRWYPISIDPDALRARAAGADVVAERLALHSGRDEQLVVRADRADPSKNIVRGLQAFAQMLQDHPGLQQQVRMLAIVQPSRQDVPLYRQYLARVETMAQEINDLLGTPGWAPIDLRVGPAHATVLAAYVEADVLFVNPVRDGMNLVAKEGVLLNDRDGVLVLSQHAGVFEELGAFALGVHPLDLLDQADALHRALVMPEQERHERLKACRAVVERNDANRWLAQQLQDVETLRAARPTPVGSG